MLRFWTVLAVVFFAISVFGANAQDSADIGPLGVDVTDEFLHGLEVSTVRTDSPQETLASFIRLRTALETALLDYPSDKTATKARHIEFLFDQMLALIDLSSTPPISEREIGISTVSALLDIFGRVGLPELSNVPTQDGFKDEGFAQYRIPGTPIRITRLDSGPREREFLFNERAMDVAPRFASAIQDQPLKSPLGINNWSSALPQLTGPLVPNSLVLAMPDSLLKLWIGTPLWKIITVLLILALVLMVLAVLHIVLLRIEPESHCRPLMIRLLRPAALLVVVLFFMPFIEHQINTSGSFSVLVGNTATMLVYVSSAWLIWLIMRLFAETIIFSPRIDDDSLDANLLRLATGSVGFFGAVGLLAFGMHQLGLPVVSILAGLGVGGLALALAIRPTLENLIGGFILYLDQPASIGDYCTFGELGGVVEKIGIRSTTLVALDQTLITIPNAQFADMQIVNWSRNDVEILRTIGLRYETDMDQMRYILTKIREMLLSHPKIDNNSVRVRFLDFGDFSLEILLRVFVKTRNWNEYYAVQEDVMFRVGDIVKNAGADFAFPSQTLYMGKDGDPVGAGAEDAVRQVEQWRRKKQFPFPQFSAGKMEELEGTLKYPPPGSPDENLVDEEGFLDSENLSAESFEAQQGDLHHDEAKKDG